MKLGSTGLALRELKINHQSMIELSQKSILKWIDSLPIANLGESSQNIYKFLVNMNQTIVEPELRLEILNIIEPVALKLMNSLENQFINKHISLTEKQKKIATLVQAMQSELSLGFHATIEAIYLEGIKRSTKQIFIQAICEAIKCKGQTILRCYQLYASIPSRVWKELYCLYRLAREHQLELTEVKTPNTLKKYTAKSSFIQIILLGIANPYKLRQNEIELLWGLLPEYVEYCNLESHSFSKFPFYINLNSSSPPVQKTLYQKKDGEIKLKITLIAVIDRLKIDLAQVTEKIKYSAAKTMLFKHLINCWSQNTQRSFARTRCQENIQASIGLAATHYLLSENIKHKQPINHHNEEPTQQGLTLEAMEGSLKDATISTVVTSTDRFVVNHNNRNYLSSSAVTSEAVWDNIHGQINKADKPTSIVTKKTHDTIVKENYKLQTCQLINMSPGGYCIQLLSNELPRYAQTGEVIGFSDGEAAKQRWSIGIVRWVKRQIKDNFIQMGIQLIAPDVLPISLLRKINNNDNKNSSSQRALLLPALTGVGQAATIITNPLSFNVNNKLHVTESSKKYEIRLTKEISSSGSSRQFSFDVTTPTNQESNNEINQLSNPEQIDSIWDLI
jgi:hypothetical protein